MYFLSHLNLSDNKLLEKISWGNQLQTFCDTSIYNGNHDKAPSESPFQTKGQEEESKNRDESENIWLYVRFALGSIVGLGGVYLCVHDQTSYKDYLFPVNQ